MSCRLIKLNLGNSSSHLKYRGKIQCAIANTMSSIPIILRFTSMFGQGKFGYKRCDFIFVC
jgi:hypothetical protein